MDVTPTDPPGESPALGPGDPAFSLRPNRGKWSAALARSTAALDAALRASLSTDRGTAPLTTWQRARTAGAAVVGVGGVGGLATLAGLRPDLGAYEPAALTAAITAAALPAALCVRRALVGAERRSAERASAATFSEPTSSEAPSNRRADVFQRLMGSLRRPDRASRRHMRRQGRAASRALADIARRERRLAESVAAADELRRGPAAVAPPLPIVPPSRPAEAAPSRALDPAVVHAAEQGTAAAPWTMPREIAVALADLETRERLHAERIVATRRSSAAAPAAPHSSAAAPSTVTGRTAAAPLPKTRRHHRIMPRNTRTLIATEDGRKLNATVLDVSLSGVAIEGNLPGLWIGSMVTVGSRRAKAVRVLPRGMAFEFSMPVPAEALTVDFVL